MLSMVFALFSGGRGRLNRLFFAIVATTRFVWRRVILLLLGKWLSELDGVGKLLFSLCSLDGLTGASSSIQYLQSHNACARRLSTFTAFLVIQNQPCFYGAIYSENFISLHVGQLSRPLTLQSYGFLFARQKISIHFHLAYSFWQIMFRVPQVNITNTLNPYINLSVIHQSYPDFQSTIPIRGALAKSSS
jgi:hypothetical protein